MPNLSRALILSKLHLIAARIQFTALSRQILASIFNLHKFRIAMIGATFSLRGLALGVKAFMLALGPLGIAMIAITTVWTLWETNTFGVRDAIQDLWKWLKVIMPVLAALELLVRSVFPPAEEAMSELGTTTDETKGKLVEFGEVATDMGTDLKTGIIPDLGILTDGFNDVTKGAKTAGQALDTFKKKRDQLSIFGVSEGKFLDEVIRASIATPGGVIISKTGRQLVGFIQTTLEKEGTEAAIAAARVLFPSATVFELKQMVRGFITISSRVLAKGLPSVAQLAGGLTGAQLGRGGRASIKRARQQLTSGARTGAAIARFRAETRQRILPLGLIEEAARFGITFNIPRGIVGRRRTLTRNIAIFRYQTALEIARVTPLVEAAQAREISRISGLASQAGLSFQETQTIITSSQQGETDIVNIIAFQDRVKLEANTV